MQILSLEDSTKFIELVIKHMKNFGVKVNKNVRKQPDLKEQEVTLKAYENMNLDELLENIMVLESRLQDELTVDLVTSLMAHYQKVILILFILLFILLFIYFH